MSDLNKLRKKELISLVDEYEKLVVALEKKDRAQSKELEVYKNAVSNDELITSKKITFLNKMINKTKNDKTKNDAYKRELNREIMCEANKRILLNDHCEGDNLIYLDNNKCDE